MENSLKHHFLIAMPNLNDSFFYRSVVYICEHDENGTMGLIVNRPTRILLEELLGHLKIDNHSESAKQKPIMFGGPVQKSQGMVIHDQIEAPWKTSMQVAEDIFVTTSTDILQAIGTNQGPEHSLVTLGYAGWEAGQLEKEISENSWLTVLASHDLLFDTPADDMWHKAAETLGVDINLMSSMTGRA
jgi:putative transcriptional regulator